MTNRAEFDIRPAVPDDHTALLGLSPRLTIGVAPWRDSKKVADAVRGWITSSLASARQEGHAVLVALLGGQVAGLVSLAEREHFTREMEWAAGRGLAHITLETGADNHRARHFYECAGFQEEDIRLTKPVQSHR